MIKSFSDRRTAAIYDGTVSKGLSSNLARRARAKLIALDSAQVLEFLRDPPGNRLEALAGNRAGQYAIRVNRQWRICFRWWDGHAWDIELVDYH